MSKSVRVRLAPSPTGFVHIGTLRTGLFSFLFARNQGGVNILRMEDTDQNRLVLGATENLIQVFKALGIEFDEGMRFDDQGKLTEVGDYGPYLQSERLSIYHAHLEQLLEKQKAYYCFCSEARLEEVRKEQMALKKPPMYDKHCRYLTAEQVAEKQSEFVKSNVKPVVRFAIPETGETVVHDLVHGKSVYRNELLDDQVLLKADGFPTYHLAVVVDDHLMQISHVIRGDDWVPSTPKHVLLYDAFGWEAPLFAHLPLILNPDKTKLSKRNSDVSVSSYLEKGYLPEALINFVALLGWNPKTEQEFFTMDELVAQFDLAKVNKAGAVLDINKLNWINGHYIRSLDVKTLTDKVLPFLTKAGVDVSKFERHYLEAMVALEKDRLKKLSDLGENSSFYFQTPQDYAAESLIWKKSDQTTTHRILTELQDLLKHETDTPLTQEAHETKVKSFIESKGYDNGSVLWPLRVALSGLSASPSPFELLSVLSLGWGREEIQKRLSIAISKLS